MACACPIVVRNEETGFRSEVRCGQCRSCRLRRKQAWVGRMRLEASEHVASRFITLTYKDDPGILDYRDFQLFMKRYRKEKGNVRFFCVGEYGGKSGRGHYHAILFGHAPEVRGFSRSLSDVWGNGFCYDGTVTPDSIGYVAGYCFKDNYTELKKPFVRMSLQPGIGMERIAEMGRLVARKGNLTAYPTDYTVGGKRYPLCDGGLVKFQITYLENGGLPPTNSNPMERHSRAVDRLIGFRDGGSHFAKEAETLYALRRRYDDGSALKKER